MKTESKSRWRWTWAGYFATLAFCAVVLPSQFEVWAAICLVFITGIQFGWNIRCDVVQLKDNDGN